MAQTMKCIPGTSKLFILGNFLSNPQNIESVKGPTQRGYGLWVAIQLDIFGVFQKFPIYRLKTVLRITSNDKVVKRVFVTVMGVSIKVLNLCHAFTSGWGEEKGKVVG